ncbi:MAG: aminopeptidase P family protein [Ectothiorhodospiraceae bacterium]|nr:aminopeptidase P family protein [Ectothiorhodospiraceae bacterium]
MDHDTPRHFSDQEYALRRERVRERMRQRGLDACLIASPENIYYLTGLDHMGYFAYQLLILPAKGQPILLTRAMERATVRDQVPDVVHVGYADGTEPPAGLQQNLAVQEPWANTAGIPTRDLRRRPPRAPSAAVAETVRALTDAGLAGSVLALDQNSTFLPYSIAEGIMDGTPDADWQDLGNLVDNVRILQSPAELELTRQAARISDSMLLSAIAAAGEGINSCDVMAAIYDAMFRRGGTYPGFVPLVRSTSNLDHEHGTWEDRWLEAGDLLFLEMAGCIRRYHAPMGRFVFIEKAPREAYRINAICQEAMEEAAAAIRPEARAGDVYEQWQSVLNTHGLERYTRHHCGYSVGIGYPPSWSGSGVPVGLRRNSDMELKEGMVFHLMSWLLRSELGDAFLSDTIVVTAEGCQFLTTVNRDVIVR